MPAVGTFLLVFVPAQNVVPEWIIRAAMLVGAIVAPLVIGAMALSLSPASGRGGIAGTVLRGYPLTVVLAGLLIFLAVLAIWRKANSLVRRWTDAHVPFVVKPGAYDQVADDLRRAVEDAGIAVTARDAPAAMSKPARWLAAVAGRGAGALVPDRLIELHGPGLEILIYPMDVLISGKPDLVMRAPAAMASRLTTSAAHLTVSAEAQAIEDRLTELARHPDALRSPTPRSHSPRSTSSSRRCASHTRNGRSSTASDSRSSVTSGRRRWPNATRSSRRGANRRGIAGGRARPATRRGGAAVVNAAADEKTMAALVSIPVPWPWRAVVIAGVAVTPVLAGAARRLIRRSRIRDARREQPPASPETRL